MDKVIDLEKVIRTSDSKFIRRMPIFAIRLLSKIVCEYEMNEAIWVNRKKDGVPFINDVLEFWKVKVIVKGEENIPASGRFVFVSNHPVGGIDALSFYSLIYRHFKNVKSPTNQLLSYIPNLRSVMLGVNVFGVNTKETVRKINELFSSDDQVMIFPAGTVSRRSRGVISDIEWQKTFITKAIQYERDVIPVHISGRNSNLFYFTANLRKFLGMKTGIEIILIPRDMIKQRGTTFTLTVGKPISRRELSEKFNNPGGAAMIKELVYRLPSQVS